MTIVVYANNKQTDKNLFSGGKKSIFLSPMLHAIRAINAGYIQGSSEDRDTQQVTLWTQLIAQYAFDYRCSTFHYWNENDTYMLEPNWGPLAYPTYRNGWPPCLQSIDRSNGAEWKLPLSQTQWPPGEPLGINWLIGKGTLYCWRATAICRLTWMSLMKDRTQMLAKLAKLQAVILGIEDTLTNNWSHRHIFIGSGHCQWFGHLVWPMARTIPYPTLFLWGKELWECIAS